jgi:type II secretory pathway pseudopilin PulG
VRTNAVPRRHTRRIERGFVLLALVLALVIFGLSLAVIKINQSAAVREANQVASSGVGKDKIDSALITYAKVNKRLPCPALATDTAGKESGVDASNVCLAKDGVVPWGTLDLSLSDSLDSWGRRISYRVYSGANGFNLSKSLGNSVDGLDAQNCNTSSSLTTGVGTTATVGGCADYHETRSADFLTGKGLTVVDSGSSVTGVAYVLISHGPTGYGSFGSETTGIRMTMPNAASHEYANATAPSNGTYYAEAATTSTVSADSASHFDDLVTYRTASDLITRAGLASRNWGTVSADLTFSQSTITAGATLTMTVTLSSSIPLVSRLTTPLTITIAGSGGTGNVSASTTCLNSAGTAATVSTSGLSLTLPTDTRLPASGTCTITAQVTPTQPAAPNQSAIVYSTAISQYALIATPNLNGTASTTDAAAVRNLSASATRTFTATAPPPKVTSSAGANGSISPLWNQQGVTLNSQQVFTVTPNTGYAASVSGTCGGTLVGTTYTTNPITSDCTVVATFTQVFTVTPSASAGGSISPATPQTVPINTTTSFTVTPNTGYTATVGGTCGGSLNGTTFTTNTITSNCTVAASFYKTTADSTFTVSDFSSALGYSVSANTTTGQKTIAFPGFSVTSMSTSYAYLGYISNSGFTGLGLANAAAGGSVSEITTGVSGAGIRLSLPIAYRYLGITLYRFGTTSGGTVIERASAKFYDANNNVIATQTLKACRNGTGSQAANFSLDPGAYFQTVEITPLLRTVTNAASSFFVGEVAFCLTNSSCKTNYSNSNGSSSDCPYP